MRIFLILLSLFLMACQEVDPKPEVTHASNQDFEEADLVSAQLADGFKMELWAPGPLLSNAVSLSFDHKGNAYVAETSRRKSSDLDIRAHRDWMMEDIGLQSLEDTRAFHLAKLSPDLSDQNTWQEDFNGDSSHDYRDLMVQTERIRRIWDSDGDGKADTQHSISHGYGIHIGFAGHDMSGLTIGPDGKIYWSIGDLGVNVTDQEGNQWPYPNQGAVMRANPDGSDFEVFAHGLRNPQELAFDAYGNLISVDNDGDHKGEHERYVHIIEGSDSGWRINWQYGKYNNLHEDYKIWMDEGLHLPYFEGQAAYLLPPLALAYNGPAGLTYNPGTGLGTEWQDYFFATYFTGSSANSMLQAFKLKPYGASFKLDTTMQIVGGIVPTGVTFGPDGALYVNDWKDGYDKKPTGRVWKVDLTNSNLEALRKETQSILSAGFSKRDLNDLKDLMGHTDMRVRMEAQFELVRRDAKTELLEVAQTGESQYSKMHAIWGLGQMARENLAIGASIIPFLQADEPELRAQAAKVLGDAKCADAFPGLIQLLKASPRAQFFAAEALGKLKNNKANIPLIELLASQAGEATHLRHAIAYALSKIGNEAFLSQQKQHSSLMVRLGAVVALRRMKSKSLAEFLKDQNPLVVIEAARAIHDDFSVPSAMPDLAASLNQIKVQDEAFLRRAINANLRLGGFEQGQRLIQFALDAKQPEAMRAEALIALSHWNEPSPLDRVDNRYRKMEGRVKVSIDDLMLEAAPKLFKSPSEQIKRALLFALGNLSLNPLKETVFQTLKTNNNSDTLRWYALNALHKMNYSAMNEALDIAFKSSKELLKERSLELLSEVNLEPNTLFDFLSQAYSIGSVPEQQIILSNIGKLEIEGAVDFLKERWTEFRDNALDKALVLDVILAMESHQDAGLQQELETYFAELEGATLTEQYSSSLFGGNMDKGKSIFYRNETAQCVRCHAINGQGGAAGPDLSQIALELNRREILESLMEPNARIAQGYGTVLLKSKEEDAFSATFISEDDQTIKVKIGATEIQEFAKSELEEIEFLPSGMLPVASFLSRSEIRDLIAFLVTLNGED